MLGKKLRQLREQRGITSQELAEMANVSQPYISQIENDRRQPSFNTLQAIAYALKTSVEALTEEEPVRSAASAAPQSAVEPSEVFYAKPAPSWQVREMSLNSLVDYAFAVDNARRANITPEELYEAVEALKKLKRLRR